MKNTFKILSLLLVCSALIIFSTCKIGLGSVVDTREPQLDISYPPESVVIKNSFILTGTCSDDIGVSKVKVEITNSDNGKSYGPFDADISGNTWSITLNKSGSYNGFEYCDGRYVVNVQALDESGRKSSIISRSFDIDNTAPVLYLSKPLSKGTDTIVTTFGKQVKVAGEISENHITEQVTARLKEYDTATLQFLEEKVIVINDTIEISADTPLMLARHYSESECEGDAKKTALRENYLKLYPDADTEENPDDKTVFCTFELVDNARTYQNPGDSGTGEGNKSTRYFVNGREFANTLVSDAAYGLSAENMKKLINGTSTLSAEEQAQVKQILENHSEFYVDSANLDEYASKFLLNPNNNPTFKVEGFANDDSAVRNPLNSDSSFTVEINSGKDSTLVKTKSISIYVESEAKDGAGKPVFTKTYVCSSSVPENEKPEGAEYWSATDETKLTRSITIGKSDGLVSGSAYKIMVTGTDRDGNEICAANGKDKGYGFVLSSLAIPPKVNIDESLSGKYYSADYIKQNGITIPFTVETDSVAFINNTPQEAQNLDNAIRIQANQVNSGKDVNRSGISDVTEKLVSKNGNSNYSAKLKIQKPASYNQNGNIYSMELKAGGDADSVDFGGDTGVFKYSFYILALDANNKSGSAAFIFNVDNEKPVISNSTVSISNDTVKVLEKTDDAENKWINGTAYIKAKIYDNYELNAVSYKVYAHSSKGDELVAEENLSATEELAIPVDTTNSKFAPIVDAQSGTTEYKQIKLEITATDSVGNTTEYSTTFDKTYIDQTTDIPSVTPGNFSFGKTKNELNSTTNIFGKDSKLIGKISDDDGIANNSVLKITDSNGTVKSTTNLSSSDSFNISLPNVCGFYTVSVEVYDSTYADATDAVKPNRTVTYTTVIAVDMAAPVFEETAVGTEDTQYKSGKTADSKKIKFLFTLSDDLGLPATGFLTVSGTKDGTADLSLTQNITAKENNQYVYEFNVENADEADYDFEFVATDLAGNTSTITRCICKDATAPAFATDDENKPRIITEGTAAKSGDDDITWYNTQTLQLKGSVSDASSGVKLVQYKVNSGNWKTFTGTTSFEETLTGLKHGDFIYINATDGAENTSENVTIGALHLDNIAPTITTDNENDILLNGENDLTLKGKVYDNTDSAGIYGVSGIKQILIKCGESVFTSPDLTLTSYSSNGSSEVVWSATIPAATVKSAFSAVGSGKVYAQVMDKAGNTSEAVVASIKYDAQYPEAKIATVTYFGTETAVTEANKKIVIKGTAKDNQILKSVKLQYTESGKSDWKDYDDELTSDFYSWSFEVNTEDECFIDGKSYVFRAVATDDAGNTGNSYAGTSGAAFNEAYYRTIKINKYSDFPVLTVSNLSFVTGKTIENMNSSVRAQLVGSNKLYVSVYDDDGVAKVEYKSGYEWTLTAGSTVISYFTASETPKKDDPVYTDSGCVTAANLKVEKFDDKNKKITIGSNDYEYKDVWTDITGKDSFVISQEGPNILMFRVKDKQGTSFVTNNTDANVMLVNKEKKSPSTKDNRIFIDVDTKGPSVDDTKTKVATAVNNVYGSENTDLTKEKFGGIHTKFKMWVTVKDPNGVKSVVLKNDSISNVNATCQDSSHSDGAEHVWLISDVDVSGMETGNTQFTLELTDNYDNVNESTVFINIDNTPSTIGFESHKNEDQVSSAFILKGYLTDSDSETTVKYYVDASSSIPGNHNWSSDSNLIHTSGSFRMNVDGKTSADDNETHTVSHKQLFVNAYGTAKGIKYEDGLVLKNDGSKYLEVLPLYFHFQVTDRCGNTSTETLILNVDPQGDIPTVEVTYPVYTAGKLEMFSGKVRAQGKATAKGDNSIVGVYMQIASGIEGTTPAFDDTKWKGSSADAVKAAVLCPDGTTTLSSKLSSETPIEMIYDRYNAKTGESKTSNIYGIYLGNAASWSLTLNSEGELESSSGKNTIGIRMYVVDSAGNCSVVNTKNDVFLTLDSNAPQIGSDVPLYVYKYKWVDKSDSTKVYYTSTATPAAGADLYTDSGCRNKAADVTYSESGYTADFISAEYTDGMSLKGEWWLNGSAMDGSEIKSLIVKTPKAAIESASGYDLLASGANHSNITKKNVYKDPSDTNKGILRKGYVFNYRIGVQESDKSAGSIRYEIIASDGTDEGTRPVTISYDNKAPVLLDAGSDDFAISSEVRNSYGFYTFGSTAYEGSEESGFSRVVVYFERDESKIYDTYLAKTAKINNVEKTNELAVSDLTEGDEGLWWKTDTVTAISGKIVTVSANDRNIHKGGLVKFGGAYYIITNYTAATGELTLDGNPSESLKGSSIYYAIGNVIDTVGSETDGSSVSRDKTTDGYGYYTDSIDNTDDFMIESTNTTTSGATKVTKWTGSINSNNIPDGPIVIHYVVFDKAGNSVHSQLAAEVENNNPRLASVKVWCDFDGNNVEAADGSESKTYYYKGAKRYKADGTEFEAATEVTKELIVANTDANKKYTAFMVVKNKVKFFPEIVGGNGDLYYHYDWLKADGTSYKSENGGKFGEGNDSNVDVVADNYDYLKADKDGVSYIEGYTTYGESNTAFNLAEVTTTDLAAIGNSSTATPAWFNYSIYDSTAGCKTWPSTEGRHQATFNVALNIQYADTVAPVVNVKPFYYNSLNDNSIYGSSSATDYRDLKGHIELEDHIKDISAITGKLLKTKTYTTARTMGADPKVSGIITVHGTAYDNIGLSELYVNFTSHSKIGSTAVKAATYSGGKWTSAMPDTASNMSTNGWTFTVEDVYNTEDGHLVNWKCNIDTSFITNLAELDREFSITAYDTAKTRGATKANQSSAKASKDVTATKDVLETDVTKFNRPNYQMDVVPYITKVTTKLSAGDSVNPSKVSRTALGHYPVYQVTTDVSSDDSWEKETVEIRGFNFAYTVIKEEGKEDVELDYLAYTPDATEYYSLTQNDIPTLNNLNNNAAANGYNMQPNGLNNNILTDDVFFDVWQFNAKAAIGVTDNSKVDNLVMKINPNNGVIGMAFSNSTEYFSMPTNSNSYGTRSRSYDYLKWNGLGYDVAGNSFGCSVGGDINSTENYSDTFNLFAGKWSVADTLGRGNHKDGTNGIRIDKIGQYLDKTFTGTVDTSSKTNFYKNKNRFQSQSFATFRASDNKSTYLYLAYYDALNDEIRFQSGQFADTLTNTNFGKFTDYTGSIDKYSNRVSICQVIAEDDAAGPFVSIGVDKNNTLAMVWYDGTNLNYKYSTAATLDTTSEVIAVTWSDTTQIMSAAGKYCKLVVDNQNGVHIAAYDEKNTALRYAYLSSPSEVSKIKYAVVDSYLDVGEQLTIDVAQSDSYQIPYIGYWGGFNEKPRYAYLADPGAFYGSGEKNGAVSDKYTGTWECTIIPVPNTPNKNLINVGVWKYNGDSDDDGKLAYSTTGTNRGKPVAKTETETDGGTNSYTSSTADNDSGTCYGNGTNNAVLAFSYDVGGSTRWIETAQMK